MSAKKLPATIKLNNLNWVLECSDLNKLIFTQLSEKETRELRGNCREHWPLQGDLKRECNISSDVTALDNKDLDGERNGSAEE